MAWELLARETLAGENFGGGKLWRENYLWGIWRFVPAKVYTFKVICEILGQLLKIGGGCLSVHTQQGVDLAAMGRVMIFRTGWPGWDVL